MTNWMIGGPPGTGLAQIGTAAASTIVPVLDPADTTTPPANSYGSNKWATVGQLLRPAAYVFPTGDQTGAADVAAINEVIGNGGVAQLVQAPLNTTPYMVKSPLLPQPDPGGTGTGCGIKGAQPWASSVNDTYGPAGGGFSGGTTIYAVAGFTGAAVIDMTNTTGTQYTGVSLEDFCIEGFSTGGSGAYGILIDGAWGAGFIRGVTVHRPDRDCIRFQQDATSGDVPDEWLLFHVKASASRNGYGVYIDNLPDSRFIGCNSSENDIDGWFVNYSENTGFLDCKGENNGGAGFHLTGYGSPGGSVYLTSCTTHLNNFDGFLFDNPNSNPSGNYQLANCEAISDGQAGGTTYAGYRSNGSRARVMAVGCFAFGAAYGAYEGGGSYGMCFTGSYLSGTTAATHDDGSNTHALVNQSTVPW